MLTTKLVRMVSSGDWDRFVKEVYNRPYCFQQQGGCRERGTFNLRVPYVAGDYGNDMVQEVYNGPDMGVSFAAWLARDPLQPLSGERFDQWSLSLWWERNFYPEIQMVANDLHARGLLEAGDYIIDIDW